MSISYKISLRPVTDYYFGNERTLGPDNADYFAASNYFPQQTTLLGMMRYRLLEMKGWLWDHNGHSNADPQKVNQLIGPKGFNSKQVKQTQGFGAIQKLSPVLLEKSGALLLPGSLNKGYELQPAREKEIIVWASLNGIDKNYLPQLDHFDYKNTVGAHFISAANEQKLEYKDLFRSYEKVGITKQKEGEKEDKGFFKQQKLSFSGGDIAFVFYIELSEKEGEELADYVADNPLVPMGGERSIFNMTMKKETFEMDVFSVLLKHSDLNPNRSQLIFVSDAIVPNDVYEYCEFAVTRTKDFRHIINTHSRKNYDKPDKSDGYQLLAKGSVLYPLQENISELIEKISTEVEAFRQIGYNSFIQVDGGKAIPHFYPNKNEQNS